MRKTQAAQVPLLSSTSNRAPLSALASVTARQGLPDLAQRLMELRDWLCDELQDLNEHLTAMAAEPKPDVAWHAAHYLLGQPGKRVRPICVVLAARMGGRAYDAVVRDVAMACELVHSATLLHDDVLDQGTERRGVETARVIYGNSASVLGGDHLLIEALRRVQKASPTLALPLIEVIDEMVGAEARQLEARNDFSPSRERYLDIVLGKTASLFRWALTAGGHLGNLDAQSCEILGSIGENLGMTFQMVDDLLDLQMTGDDTGKNALQDLNEGKLTWPLIIACERSPAIAAQVIEYANAETDIGVEKIAKLLNAIRETGAIEETRLEAARYADKAYEALSQLPEGESTRALATVVQTALHRRK